MVLGTFELGSRCMAKLKPLSKGDGDSYYPAIYIEGFGDNHLVYIKHLDKTEQVGDVKEDEPTLTNEKTESMKFCYMESPAYFKYGTALGFKWGLSAFVVDKGERMDVPDNGMVEKIITSLNV